MMQAMPTADLDRYLGAVAYPHCTAVVHVLLRWHGRQQLLNVCFGEHVESLVFLNRNK